MSFGFKGIIKIFHKRGPRAEPCGTPDNTEKDKKTSL
jgi:hypothetical protein